MWGVTCVRMAVACAHARPKVALLWIKYAERREVKALSVGSSPKVSWLLETTMIMTTVIHYQGKNRDFCPARVFQASLLRISAPARVSVLTRESITKEDPPSAHQAQQHRPNPKDQCDHSGRKDTDARLGWLLCCLMDGADI